MNNQIERRVRQLKAMGDIIIASDNEDLIDEWRKYLNDDDYESIAEEDYDYCEVCSAFIEMLSFNDFTV